MDRPINTYSSQKNMHSHSNTQRLKHYPPVSILNTSIQVTEGKKPLMASYLPLYCQKWVKNLCLPTLLNSVLLIDILLREISNLGSCTPKWLCEDSKKSIMMVEDRTVQRHDTGVLCWILSLDVQMKDIVQTISLSSNQMVK